MGTAKTISILVAALLGGPALADVSVTVHRIDANGVHESIGSVTFSDSAKGLHIKPDLKNLPPGEHGFHVHTNSDCGPAEKDGKMTAGLRAGGHYDPGKSEKHEGPDGHGHLGDLPALVVAADGAAKTEMLAPRLKLADIMGRSLMIHEGGDNFADQPKPLGGGGGRIACGVIK
jgi:superoxide dismutase, Cu-Zn family